MSLSIKNISESDINALTHCNLANEILAYDLSAENGSQKLIRISKDKVTCWQKFLRIFNSGDLANKKIHLVDINSYLNQYNWSEIDQENNPQYQTYLKVCDLANKGLVSKRNSTLFDNVGKNHEVNTTVKIKVFLDEKLESSIKGQHSFKWNPRVQAKHIAAAVYQTHPQHVIRIKDQYDRILCNETYVSKKDLQNLHISGSKYLKSKKPAPIIVEVKPKSPTTPYPQNNRTSPKLAFSYPTHGKAT